MAVNIIAIDNAINALVTNPQVNYSIGDKSVSAGDLIRQLMELRTNLAQTPSLEVDLMTFDWDVALSGFDATQVVVP